MYEFHYDYITLNVNVTIIQDHYLQTLIVKYMKIKLKMSTKILAATKKYLLSLILHLNQNTMIIQINWSSAK